MAEVRKTLTQVLEKMPADPPDMLRPVHGEKEVHKMQSNPMLEVAVGEEGEEPREEII